MSSGSWRRLPVGKHRPPGIPVLLGQQREGVAKKFLKQKKAKKVVLVSVTDSERDWEASTGVDWGEENRGFQDETNPPLPDLLVDLHGAGCSYNVGQDRVTLLQKSDVGEECKEAEVIVKKREVVREREVLEIVTLGKEAETAFTWAKTNLNMWRAKIDIVF